MNKMRELRKQAGLTMKELGKIVGVSESTISLYERGQHEPDLVTLSRIAKCLNTSVDYLLGRDDVPDAKKEPAVAGRPDEHFSARVALLSPENRARMDAYLDGLLAAQDAQAP